MPAVSLRAGSASLLMTVTQGPVRGLASWGVLTSTGWLKGVPNKMNHTCHVAATERVAKAWLLMKELLVC